MTHSAFSSPFVVELLFFLQIFVIGTSMRVGHWLSNYIALIQLKKQQVKRDVCYAETEFIPAARAIAARRFEQPP